jgi:hypothetical protein
MSKNLVFEYKRHQTNKIPEDKIIEELKRVAKIYNYVRFTRHEFDKVAKYCKGTTVLNYFGTWSIALNAIGKKLAKKEIDRSIISKKELFREMERIWRRLGHRPSKTEWEISSPKYSYTTYKTRFNGWTNACLKFIDYKMGKAKLIEAKKTKVKKMMTIQGKKLIKKYKREIPMRIRLKVLKRDGFRCKLCGKSPAIERGVVLHIDHILPIAKGGKTAYENLQTLCKECNLGKSDL